MGKLINNTKSEVWMDFDIKMNYLLVHLFDGNEDKLISYFSDKGGNYNHANRKKTIKNWLNGESKKPNGFDINRFKIGEILFNDAPLVNNKSFRLLSFEKFKDRIDSYLTHREVQRYIKKIYFFDTHREVGKVVAFEVNFPDKNQEDRIELTYANIRYLGRIESFNNITYIRVKNEYDYMSFVFKISANTAERVKIFGVGQSVDDMTGRPKAFSVLLSSYPLSEEEQELYAHKLNHSNMLFAEEFESSVQRKEEFFLENFAQKIETLGMDLHHYGIKESFSRDLYLDIVLKEYQSYIKFLRKARKHTKYFISSKRESDLLSMKGIYQGEKISVSIVYFLTMENLFLLDEKNPIVVHQMGLVKEGKIDLEYIFVVPDIMLLSDRILEKIEEMQRIGIAIRMSDVTTIGYSKLLLIEGMDFALFRVKDLVGDPTHVTQYPQTIEKLRIEREILRRDSYTLEQFMKRYNPLTGRWYFYAYGSALSHEDCHEIVLDVHNNHVRGLFSSGVHFGTIHKGKDQIIFIFDNSIIKVFTPNINGTIFRVSSIGRDIYINHADLLVFGLFSKQQLTKDEALSLLSEIHMKEEVDYRLKVSDSFPRRLAEFKERSLS